MRRKGMLQLMQKGIVPAMVGMMVAGAVVGCKDNSPSGKAGRSITLPGDDPTAQGFDRVEEFKYKGHDYLKFSKFRGQYSGYESGVVHDPDCGKCLERYE